MEVSGQLHDPGRFTTRERATGTHWIGGWVSHRAVLDAVVKRKIPSLCRESNPPSSSPLAQYYTTELSWLLFSECNISLSQLWILPCRVPRTKICLGSFSFRLSRFYQGLVCVAETDFWLFILFSTQRDIQAWWCRLDETGFLKSSSIPWHEQGH
jgi:hypothetical protein